MNKKSGKGSGLREDLFLFFLETVFYIGANIYSAFYFCLVVIPNHTCPFVAPAKKDVWDPSTSSLRATCPAKL